MCEEGAFAGGEALVAEVFLIFFFVSMKTCCVLSLLSFVFGTIRYAFFYRVKCAPPSHASTPPYIYIYIFCLSVQLRHAPSSASRQGQTTRKKLHRRIPKK